MHKVRDCSPKPNLLNLATFFTKTYRPTFNFAFTPVKTLETDFAVN
jgi:hypothetical protein